MENKSKTFKKNLSGVVLSAKMSKTVVVEIEQIKVHPVYGKRLKRLRKVYAQNDLGAKLGDKVAIEETRPLSRLKRWKVVKVQN